MTDTAVLRIRVESSGIGKAGSDLSQLTKQGVSAESVLGKLRSVAFSVSTALAANTVIKYADAWTSVSNKLANVIKDGESLVEVQNRVFAIAQRSNSSIEATATLYGRLEPATRGLINSGSELGSVIETINKAMSVSGATSSEAAGALVQLAQGLGAGALRGEEFNSVNEAAPRLMQAIADSLGVSRGELKNYAAQGKLTSEVVINAMKSQSSAIDTEFSKMNVTFEQKGVKAFNNLIKAFGDNSGINSAVSSLGDVMVALSEHVDLVINAGEILAVTYGSKLVGSITESIQTKLADISANAELATSNLRAAQAAVTQATAEKQNAIAAQQSLAAQLQLAQSERTRTAIRQQLAVNSAAVAAATNTETAALTRLTAATNAASIAQRTYNGVMALFGGPVGLLMIGASAYMYFSNAAEQAIERQNEFSNSVDVSTAALQEMTPAALAATQAELEKTVISQTKAFNEQKEKVNDLAQKYEQYQKESAAMGLAAGGLKDQQRELTIAEAELETKEKALSQTKSKLYSVTQTLNGNLRQNYVLMVQSNQVTGIASGIQAELNRILKIGNKVLETRNNYVMTSQSIFTDKDKQALVGLQKQINLEKTHGEQRAKLQAQYDAESKGLSGKGADEYIKEALELYHVQQANDAKTGSEQRAVKSVKSSVNAHQELTQKLSDLQTQLEAATLRYQGNEEAAIKLETAHELGSQAASKEGLQIQTLTLQLYRLKQAQEEAKAASDRFNSLLEQYDSLITGAKSGTIEYGKTLRDLHDLLVAGKISQDEYNAAVKRAEDNLNKASTSAVDWSAVMTDAANAGKDALAEFLYNPGEGFNEMASNFDSALRKMAAQAVAANIMDSIFSKDNMASISSWFSGLLSSSSTSSAAGAASGGMWASIGSMFSFDGGGYTGAGVRSGGVDGKGGFYAIMHPNETVIDHTKSSSQSSNNTSISRSTTVNVNQTINTTGKIDRRTSKQIAAETARKQRLVVSRFGS